MSKSMARLSILVALLIVLSATTPLPNAHAQQSASISGKVFADSNYNGMPDEGEKPISGAELTLLFTEGQAERVVQVMKSDAEGRYAFGGLAAGQYYLAITLPDGLQLSTPDQKTSIWLPASGKSGRSKNLALNDGAAYTADFGAGSRKAYINIIAFGDENMNAGRMSSEPLLQHVEASLLYEVDGQQYPIATGRTNREGSLQLRDLTPATYRLAISMPEPYIIGPLGTKLTTFFNTIIPTQGNQGISEPFALDRSIGLGVGGVKASTLSGSIWFDGNMNGQRDAGEDGVPGVVLTLTHKDMQVQRSLTTDGQADYRFEYLQAGEYTLEASLPEGFMFVPPGSPSAFTDGFKATDTMALHVLAGVPAQAEAIGIKPSSSVLVSAFHDTNTNGQHDVGEPAFAGANVYALSDGAIKASIITDVNGRAFLPRVPSGQANIQVVLTDGQVFTIAGDENGNDFSSVSAASDLTVTKDLAAGEQLLLNAGVTLPSSIAGILFDDQNLSGIMEEGEMGLAGFTVQAINDAGEIAAQTETDASGHYVLSNLVPRKHQVRILLSTPYVFSDYSNTGASVENAISSQTVAYGQTDLLPLLAGQNQTNINAGAFRSAVLSGSVLLGDDALGFQGNLGGLQAVKIQLHDENKQPVSEHTVAVTDAEGNYSLKGALPGMYYLSYTLPGDSKLSKPLTDEQIFYSDLMEVKASDELHLAPLYAVKTGSVSGLVFHDVDADGTFDTQDAALSGVEVAIQNTSTGEQYSATTGEDGLYLINGIRPGTYVTFITLPEGYILDSHPQSLASASLSNQSQGSLEIQMGTVVADGMLPALMPLALSGHLYYDNNLDHAFDPALDTPYEATLTLTHQRTGTAFSLTSDSEGLLTKDAIYPGKYLLQVELPADFIMLSPKGSNVRALQWEAPLNLNQDAPSLELAVVQLGKLSGVVWNMDQSTNDVEGIEILLKDAQGESVGQITTATDGSFAFDHLMPITYTLSATLPESYRFAREVDTSLRASIITSEMAGVEGLSGTSSPINLGMGEDKLTQDIGMGAMGKLGDFAWLDLDRDGMQDAGEPGLPGIAISLYQYDKEVAATQTDAYGRYLFDNLYPGTYVLHAQMPEELTITKQQQDFPLVGSVLNSVSGQVAIAEGLIVPSGRRNLNADLGFALKTEGVYPSNLENIPSVDWTRMNEQKPLR